MRPTAAGVAALVLFASSPTACDSPGGGTPPEPDLAASETPSPAPEPADVPAGDVDGADPDASETTDTGGDVAPDGSSSDAADAAGPAPPPPPSCLPPIGFEDDDSCFGLSKCLFEGEGGFRVVTAAESGVPTLEGERHLLAPPDACGFAVGPVWNLAPCAQSAIELDLFVDLPCPAGGDPAWLFQVHVEDVAAKLQHLAFDAKSLSCGQFGQWTPALLDLAKHLGKKVRLHLTFQGAVGLAGKGLAVDLLTAPKGCP